MKNNNFNLRNKHLRHIWMNKAHAICKKMATNFEE